MANHTKNSHSYNRREFLKDWRFAIETDFTNSEGEFIPYATDGKQQWGDETKCLTFETSPTSAVINDDSSILAIAVDHDIRLFDTTDLEFRELGRLIGHTSQVDSLAYSPGRPGTLVSHAADRRPAKSGPSEPSIIIIWDIEKFKDMQAFALSAQEIDLMANSAAKTVADSISMAILPDNQAQLASSFKMPIKQAVARAAVESHTSIHGHLLTASHSRPFSPDGSRLLYLPGKRPRSNDADDWTIKAYSLSDKKDVLTLSGHRDAIMWVGYSPDGKRIGTVAWDKTSRLWDAETGQQLQLFPSNGQNWTGGFSADGVNFATTCGQGTISVYKVEDGSEVFVYEGVKRWCRALDWSLSRPEWLAVGGADTGELLLLDVKQKKLVQRRKLSTRRAKVEEERKRLLRDYLEVTHVRFIARDESEMLVFFTSGDGSAEVYNVGAGMRKIRYARTGTDSYTEGEDKEPEEDEEPGKEGFGMEVWEGSLKTPGMFVATVDGDAVRIWHKKPIN